MRIVIAVAILFLIAVIVFNGMTDALSTEAGRNASMWTLIMVGSVVGIIFVAYVLFAYIPVFKVMPKGEIYKPRNWGKKKLKKVA